MISMIIRMLRPGDVFQHNKVASQAFVFPTDIYDDKILPSKAMIGAFDDDGCTMMADIEIYDRLCNFGNGTLRCLAVGGVASKPEFRNKGAVREIFNSVFGGKFDGISGDISILYPFSDAYYKKFGYCPVGRCADLLIPFSELSGLPKNTDVSLCEEKDLPELLELYNEAAKKDGLSFIREDGENFFLDPYKENRWTYIHRESGGKADAYASLFVDRAQSTVFIREIGYLNKAGLHGILGFLRVFEGNQDYVRFEKMPESSAVFRCTAGAKKAKSEISLAGAVRILDLKNVLSVKKYPKKAGKFVICCDDTIPASNGIFTVEYSGGKAEVSITPDAQPDITVSPLAASELIFEGVIGADDLEWMNGVTVNCENDDAVRAFSPNRIFFNDSF